MKIKICGMKYPENIQEIAEFQPDYLGFIFYSISKRYVLDENEEAFSDFIFKGDLRIQKVGVFVNEEIKNIIRIATEYDINIIQLHGDESPEFCENLQLLDFKIIKAFGIDKNFDFSDLGEYKDVCDYFLFDTKSKEFGGTGKHFDWNLLKQYNNAKPIFLSGGLEIQDIPIIHNLSKELNIHALDFNSKLEIDYGLKDIEKCRDVIQQCRNVTM
ncbi:MAG TPA: phosphoribosylanthranilate isomerase [Chitinophagales bacterium]|nr:phosphoribosylanthranilate isomerase [Chitinophagales bacterium]